MDQISAVSLSSVQAQTQMSLLKKSLDFHQENALSLVQNQTKLEANIDNAMKNSSLVDILT